MSVTFCYRVKRPEKGLSFSRGTSSDQEALDKVFSGTVSTADIRILRAMAGAVRGDSLWSEIADKLEAIQGDSNESVTLEIWPEY